MRNITVSVPDEIYRVARIRAAEMGESVSSLVAAYLAGLSDDEAEFQRLKALQDEVIARIDRREGRGFSASDRLSRDELYDRAARRAEELHGRAVH